MLIPMVIYLLEVVMIVGNLTYDILTLRTRTEYVINVMVYYQFVDKIILLTFYFIISLAFTGKMVILIYQSKKKDKEEIPILQDYITYT